MVGETIHLDVATDGHVRGSDKRIVFVNVLILVAAQQGSRDNSGVLNVGLVDRNAVIAQVERDDEAAVNVLGHTSVEAGCVPQGLVGVVNALEEITFGLLGHQVVDVAERVDFLTEAIVGGDLANNWLSGFWHLDATQGEHTAVLLVEEVLGENVDSVDVEGTTKGNDFTVGHDFVAGHVVVSDEGETGLFHFVAEWKLLSLE